MDFIIYCEGKNFDCGSKSFDEMFWEKIFSTTSFKCKTKSCGCKEDVINKMNEKDLSESKKIIFAVDSDYDLFFNKILDNHKLLYTYGYSFESDIISLINFEEIISLFCSINDTETTSAFKEYNNFLEKINRNLWMVTIVDMRYYNSSGKLFKRDSPESIISYDNDQIPKINCKKILMGARKIQTKGSSPSAYPIIKKNNAFIYFYGKTVSHLVYRWFCNFSKKYKNKHKVDYDIFVSKIIRHINIDSKKNLHAQYYNYAISRIQNIM